MNSIEQLVSKHYGAIPEKHLENINAVSLGYLFRVCTATDLTKVLRGALGTDVKVIDFRRDLQNGYFLKNVKLWIWRIVKQQHSPKKAARIMVRYGIQPEDMTLARVAMKHPVLSKKLRNLSARYRGHTLRQYESVLAQCLEDVHGYCTRFAIRKLRFLTFGGHMSHEDLVLELKYYAIYGMLLQYPVVETRLHLTNVGKRAAHNFGINLIQQQTTQGRGHLRQEKDGSFTTVKVSRDASADGYLHHINQTADITGNSDNAGERAPDFYDRVTVNTLLARHGGKKRVFLTLLTGHYDKKFSKYLNKQDLPDNDLLMERLIRQDTVNKYVDLVADFLDVSPYQTQVFMNQLRQAL